MSDHCPLLLDLTSDLGMGKRFKFEAFWKKEEGFNQMVLDVWSSIPHDGNPYVVLDHKLRATTKGLQKWSDKWIGNVKLQIGIAMGVIFRLEKAMDSRDLSPQEVRLR